MAAQTIDLAAYAAQVVASWPPLTEETAEAVAELLREPAA